MTNKDKCIIAKWFITTKLIGVDNETYFKVKNNQINDLKTLEEILKKRWDSTDCINCIRCIHISNTICNRCDLNDEGFHFRYKYYKNKMIEDDVWDDAVVKFSI